MRRRRNGAADLGLSAVALGALATFGCATRPAEPQAAPVAVAAPPSAPAPVARVGISDRAWASVTSKRYSLRIALPEAESWSVDDLHESWWTARHAASRSELAIRTWRASRLGTDAECAAQVRLWRPSAPDPAHDPSSVVETRALDAPRGFATQLSVGVRRDKDGAIEGYALALGHAIGSCYAALYTTRAAGLHAEDVVAARLALVSDGVLPRVEHLGVEDRVK